jgi:hypothetical protein
MQVEFRLKADKAPEAVLAGFAAVGAQKKDDQEALPTPAMGVADVWRSTVRAGQHDSYYRTLSTTLR